MKDAQLNFFVFLKDKELREIPPIIRILVFHEEIKTSKNNPLIIDDDFIIFPKNKITSLPEYLTVDGSFIIDCSKIKVLPKNLTVNGLMSIESTEISKIPENLNILSGNTFFIYGTPLSKEYSDNEILSLIPGIAIHRGPVKFFEDEDF
jgi:hypothetical protein